MTTEPTTARGTIEAPASPPTATPERPAPRAENRDGPRERPPRRPPRDKRNVPETIKVSFVSRPIATLVATDTGKRLCQTPCTVSIDPADGRSTQRAFALERTGYVKELVKVDLARPRREYSKTLKKDPTATIAAETPATPAAGPASAFDQIRNRK
jgi:hypothetical protein